MIRAEGGVGTNLPWYTTETEELKNCDRTYVFRNGAVVAELTRDELTEERVIQSSFAGVGMQHERRSFGGPSVHRARPACGFVRRCRPCRSPSSSRRSPG